jgi:probable F420-dependent oxidoreductase
MDLGPVGVWWSGSWSGADGSPEGSASQVESLGYGALWSSGGFDNGFPDRFGRLLRATERVAVASGILSIWHATPEQVADGIRALGPELSARFVLGLGVSHAPVVEMLDTAYARPYSRMVDYLDGLDRQGPEVGPDRRVLAALRPRMLELAAERCAGAHPYFVPVEHVARAREQLGPDTILAPELAVVLDPDSVTARAAARKYTRGYLGLANYVDNLRALGFGPDDVEGAGSDRLVDAVMAWGDVDRIAERVRQFHDAGADHVCIQVVADRAAGFPVETYRALAPALLG